MFAKVKLETTDRILEEKMLQEYPGILKESQCYKEIREGKKWYIFIELDMSCIGQWLRQYHQNYRKDLTTCISRINLNY